MYFSKSTNAFFRSVTVHFSNIIMPVPACDEKGWLEGSVGRWYQFPKNVFIKIKKCSSQIFPKYFYASDEKGWLRVQLAGSISWRPFTIFAAVIISAGHSPATRSIQEPVSPLSLQSLQCLYIGHYNGLQCLYNGLHNGPGYLCRAEDGRALAYLGGNQMSAVATT